MKRVGVLTSGGDAPGMNACLRAVVRTGIYNKLEVIGIQRGYAGLLEGDMTEMNLSSVSNIIQRGGTIIKTARSEEFKTYEGREKAVEILDKAGIDGLIVIGGDGTFRGAYELHQIWDKQIIGVPGTIDNDVYGTDWTIGYDTAVNTALDAIDKIRDTAASHERLFFVEVMGRYAGFIALEVGIAGGAEEILIPETRTDLNRIAEELAIGRARGKTSSIIVVAEGDEAGGAFNIARKVKEISGIDYRVVVLGHIQRGGSPTAKDRVLASKLGAAAIEAILQGETNKMVGEIGGKIVLTPSGDTWGKKKEIDWDLYKLGAILAI